MLVLGQWGGLAAGLCGLVLSVAVMRVVSLPRGVRVMVVACVGLALVSVALRVTQLVSNG